MFNFLFGVPKERNALTYAKIFFFMIIPVFGFFYTIYIAIFESEEKDVRSMARGAFLIRIFLDLLLVLLLYAGSTYILPNMEEWINKSVLWLRVLM